MHHRITPLARRAAIVCALTISIAGCTLESQRVTRIEHQWRCANTPAAETRCAR